MNEEVINPVLISSDEQIYFHERDKGVPLVECSPSSNDLPKSTVAFRRDVVLKSTHLIFFKIADYVDFGSLTNLHFRFKKFFIFKNVEAFCDFALATIILVAQIVILGNIFSESKMECGNQQPVDNLWMGACLCSIYASCVATEAFFQALPYEIIGTDPPKAEMLIEWIKQTQMQGKHNAGSPPEVVEKMESGVCSDDPISSTYLNTLLQFYDTSHKNLSSLDVKGISLHAVSVSTSAVSFLYLVGVSAMLQLSNLLLLVVIALIMGNSLTFSELIARFISVEVVIRVHEVVPRVLKIRDKSPHAFNLSGLDLELELENKGVLKYGRIVPADSFGQSEVYRTSAKYYKNMIFWCFFCFVYGIFLIVFYACKDKNKLGL